VSRGSASRARCFADLLILCRELPFQKHDHVVLLIDGLLELLEIARRGGLCRTSFLALFRVGQGALWRAMARRVGVGLAVFFERVMVDTCSGGVCRARSASHCLRSPIEGRRPRRGSADVMDREGMTKARHCLA
jgi:hypothetical protein